jgi:hypothetical protein
MAKLIAYVDEYPWIRCECGYLLNSDPGNCTGCGKEKNDIQYLDRFGRPGQLTEKYGISYLGVKYEDSNRR